ncbi:hypothetical protein KC19_VG075700 [Ceratodon purpureus]|uniref:Uncharacterized protein n=1 Tax=Ceratodon purpureus TaxID=3225 RepID=A0A8T0HN11_CERPU|nr:hypothetical protein KC19_VG075700 [Ceratodon purpureus]
MSITTCFTNYKIKPIQSTTCPTRNPKNTAIPRSTQTTTTTNYALIADPIKPSSSTKYYLTTVNPHPKSSTPSPPLTRTTHQTLLRATSVHITQSAPKLPPYS